jgi:hypothetical protein
MLPVHTILEPFASVAASAGVAYFISRRRAAVVPIQHPTHRGCEKCKLIVARYDDRGVCANCIAEGK